MIKIDKGIPIPEKPHGRGPGKKYPFADMEIGDSFLITHMKAHKFQPQISRAGKQFGRKFSQRTEGEGTRIWRIE